MATSPPPAPKPPASRPWTARLRRLVPARRHLRGGFLHRIFGERLFDAGLWVPRAGRVAAGLAIGTFVAFTPTIGLHLVLSALIAFALRANIPAAILAGFVTNPLTAPLIYPLEWRLGIHLSGPLPAAVVGGEGLGSTARNVLRHARPLWVGSLVFATVGASLAYGLGLVFERAWERLRAKRSARRLARRQLAASLSGISPGEADAPAGNGVLP